MIKCSHCKRIALCTVNPLLILTLFSRFDCLRFREQTTASPSCLSSKILKIVDTYIEILSSAVILSPSCPVTNLRRSCLSTAKKLRSVVL